MHLIIFLSICDAELKLGHNAAAAQYKYKPQEQRQHASCLVNVVVYTENRTAFDDDGDEI